MSSRRILPYFCRLIAVGACSSDATDPAGNGGGGGRTIKRDPSFAADIQEIFGRRRCSDAGCHGAAQTAGLDLRSGNARASLVNVNATTAPQRVRVIPGDAQNSYLVIKLEGRQTAGDRMPRGLPALDNTDLTNIRNWISQGAKAN